MADAAPVPDATRAASPASQGGLVVRPALDRDAQAWDAFVFASAEGTFFHRFAWRDIFAKIFRLKPCFLVAERGATIEGILPLVHQKSPLFGNALIAAPFCVEGGPLAKSEAIRAALDAAALALMKETGASYIEFRSRRASRENWSRKTGLYATFKRPLAADDNANLLAIPRKQRAVVRKTLTSELASVVDRNPDHLFRVYSESVRNLGTPTFPKRYFAALLDAFGPDCDIVVILRSGRPISAVMNFYFKDTVLPYYGGGTKDARSNGANDFLYWEVMRRAAARGYRAFDFGRSKVGTGAFAFKKNWGFEPDFLEYEYFLKPGTDLPEKNPNNPKYALLIAAWKRLPLPIANALGPLLIAGLG